jgi:hypothetical protein
VQEIVGAIHGHSTYSDGTGTFPEIVAAACDAGLDFLVMTDHDTLQPLQDVGEAFHGRTLLLIGCEVSPPTNHLLAVGARTCPSREQPPQDYVDDLRAQGALTFLAHPHDRGVPRSRRTAGTPGRSTATRASRSGITCPTGPEISVSCRTLCAEPSSRIPSSRDRNRRHSPSGMKSDKRAAWSESAASTSTT